MPTKYTLYATGRWQPWLPARRGLEWKELLQVVRWYRLHAPETALFVSADERDGLDAWRDFPGQRMVRYPITLGPAPSWIKRKIIT